MSLPNTLSLDTKSCLICLDTKYNDGISLKTDNALLSLFEICVGIVDFKFCPPVLCKNCANEVVQFAKFKQKCDKSIQFWKSLKENNLVFDKNHEILLKDVKSEPEDEYQSVIPNALSSPDCLLVKEDNTLDTNIDDYIVNERLNESEDDNFDSDNGKKSTSNKSEEENCNNTYQCTKCKRKYRRLKWLKNHSKVCNKNSKFKTVKTLLQTLKPKKVEDKCGLCSSTLTKHDLKQHLNEHWKNDDLKCKICDYVGRDFADMSSHRFEHYPNLLVSCHVCDKRLISVKSLQFHFRSVHLHKDGGWCTVCNETFRICRSWKRHERLHTSSRLFICDLCGRKYLYKYQIKDHLIDHSNIRKFVCETCGKSFKRMAALKGHITNIHEPSVPVVCNHCKKIFKNQEKLDLHLKKLNQQKPYECSVCSKKYALECELKSHMFWHTDERPHVCEICGSKYKAKCQLKIHMQSHTGNKPHECEICGKCFYTATQARRHSSVHTGIRAHTCTHCGRSFHGRKAMLEHSRQHKSDDTKPKAEC